MVPGAGVKYLEYFKTAFCCPKGEHRDVRINLTDPVQFRPPIRMICRCLGLGVLKRINGARSRSKISGIF
jgi:hypothetical protein